VTLPNGWVRTSLDDVVGFLTSGSRGWARYYSDTGAAFIRVQNVRRTNNILDLADVQYVKPPIGGEGERTRLYHSDILVTITADLGRVGLFTSEITAYVNQHVALVRLKNTNLAPYVAAYLISQDAQAQMGLRDRGITRAGLGLDDIRNVLVPLPPLAEQRRIIAKLDALSARLAGTRAELDRVPVLALNVRRSALDHAFSGALTQDMRTETDRPSSLAPKCDDQERGVWRTQALPSSWRWVPFDEFFNDLTNSTRKLQTTDYELEGPFPVVDQGAAEIGGYTSREEMVHPARERVVIFGDHTRCVKLVEPPFVQGADGVKVLAAAHGVSIAYSRYALMAVDIPAKGYSRHMKFVRRTFWPVAPEDEQEQIVERLDAAFARADRLEAEAARSRALLDRLEAAILARAFRGELLPQDPDDEPASVLLDRIRAQRDAAPAKPRKRAAKAA